MKSNAEEDTIEKIVRVKHLSKGKTGCTFFVFSKPLPACTFLCSSATATRDFHAAEIGASVNSIHGILLNGGSAFGLDATGGLLKYQREHGVGVKTKFGVIPICPTACIFDLSDENDLSCISPNDVYEACNHLDELDVNVVGKIGVGTGAKTSKLFTPEFASHDGGIAFHKICAPDGTTIIAMVVVNALGDVIDKNGMNLTGPVKGNTMYKTSELLRNDKVACNPNIKIENTTLVVVFINLQLYREGLQRICRAAMCGISRSIKPAFTAFDGDVVIAVSTNVLKLQTPFSELRACDLVADCVSEAIRKAVLFVEPLSKN